MSRFLGLAASNFSPYLSGLPNFDDPHWHGYDTLDKEEEEAFIYNVANRAIRAANEGNRLLGLQILGLIIHTAQDWAAPKDQNTPPDQIEKAERWTRKLFALFSKCVKKNETVH